MNKRIIATHCIIVLLFYIDDIIILIGKSNKKYKVQTVNRYITAGAIFYLENTYRWEGFHIRYIAPIRYQYVTNIICVLCICVGVNILYMKIRKVVPAGYSSRENLNFGNRVFLRVTNENYTTLDHIQYIILLSFLVPVGIYISRCASACWEIKFNYVIVLYIYI